ncbi:MAG TPA: YrdB family protein [Gaiellaceae bacterium]
MRALNLAVRFACEIATVAAFVWWGWPWIGWLVGLAVVVFWGAFVAPKAAWRLPDPLRLGCELVLFALATVAFAEAGPTAVAVVYAVAAVVTALLVRRWPEPVVTRS